jgi:L-2,4-diaminobutyrate decarboxylase
MKNPLLEKVYNAENFRKQGHQLIDTLADHLIDSEKKESKTIAFKDPEAEKLFWENYPKDNDFHSLTKDIMDRSIHVHNPKYMGHQVAPTNPTNALTSLISGLFNNGSAVYEMGMSNTALELIVTNQLCAQLGFDQTARGYLTSGGTLANLTALLAARSVKIASGVWKNGHGKPLGIMVSEEAHYCVDRAARIMGLGDQGIIKVAATNAYSLDANKLEAAYAEALARGLQIFAIVGSAPSTATGIIDPLSDMATFAEKHHLWFHVDAAHGGAAIYSKKYAADLAGIERADSVAIDGHKMMMMPSLTTALLFKDGNHSYQTFSQKADYLLSETDHEDWYNMAKRTFECTKNMMSIHWFTLLHQYGPEVFDAFVTHLYDLGKTFAQIVNEEPDFELALAPQTNIVCFRLLADGLDAAQLNSLNEQLRTALVRHGDFYIVQTKLKGVHFLRVTVMNPKTTREHITALLKQLKELSKPILNSLLVTN